MLTCDIVQPVGQPSGRGRSGPPPRRRRQRGAEIPQRDCPRIVTIDRSTACLASAASGGSQRHDPGSRAGGAGHEALDQASNRTLMLSRRWTRRIASVSSGAADTT
jgi:hypothetical protein